MDHYMQGPKRAGRPVRTSVWSVGCPCGWKMLNKGNQREAKEAWQAHMRSVQRIVPFREPSPPAEP